MLQTGDPRQPEGFTVGSIVGSIVLVWLLASFPSSLLLGRALWVYDQGITTST